MQGTSLRRVARSGDTDTRTFGGVSLTVQITTDGGYAINAFAASSGHRYDALAYSTPDRDAFRARYRQIAEAALAGKPADQIAADINGAATDAIQAAERIVTKAFAALADQGQHREVRPTMAGAHLAPTSEPLAFILAVASGNGGTIRRSKQATVAQLKALARKGLVTLNYESGRGARRVVESATLTARGARSAVTA
jgi:hypothetical protein